MIPDEAVEAAYAAINYPDQRAIDHNEILTILEAAAPHMWSTWAAKDCDGSSCCASPEHIEGCFSTNPDYRNQE